jgi:hypothetical protein
MTAHSPLCLCACGFLALATMACGASSTAGGPGQDASSVGTDATGDSPPGDSAALDASTDAGPNDSATDAGGDDASGGDAVVDDGPAEGSASDAGLACPGTEPAGGMSCAQPQGCAYATTCCFCALASGCAGRVLWGCMPLPTADPACPPDSPADGSTCTTRVTCDYCIGGGLLIATCNQVQWSTSYAAPACR